MGRKVSDAARTCCVWRAAAVVELRRGGSGAAGGALAEEIRTFGGGREVEDVEGRRTFVGDLALAVTGCTGGD